MTTQDKAIRRNRGRTMIVLQALISDDEPLARERVRRLLDERDDIAVAGEATDGREAVSALATGAYDLVFLDVQMPHLDGFDVIREVGAENMPPVVFVTAHDQHAIEAFRVHAFDYLLKPYEPARFHESVDRVVALVRADRQAQLSDRVQQLVNSVGEQPDYLRRIMVRSRQSLEFVKVDDIDYIEAAGNYAQLHVGGDSHLLRQTMKTLEQRLDPNRFVRIHRSTIVNLDRVKRLQPTFNGDYEVQLVDGTRLTLSRSHRQVLDRFS